MTIDLPRIAIAPLHDTDPIRYGVLVGFMSNASSCDRCDGDGHSAVVSLDGDGLAVQTIHLSRVSFVAKERN